MLLGTFTSVLPPAAQRTALVNLLAWKLERHGINPLGASTYVNPETGASTYLKNISGHRDVKSDGLPGQRLLRDLPAAPPGGGQQDCGDHGLHGGSHRAGGGSLLPMVPDPSGATTIPFGLIFKEPVTGLDASDLTVGRDVPGLDDRYGHGGTRRCIRST